MPIRTRDGWLVANLLGWAAMAALLSAQAYVVARHQGRPQPWWPSFGYSLAILSIWAIMTPLIVLAVQREEAVFSGWWKRGLLYAAGLPVVAAAHVGLFALLYWPLFNGGGRIASRGAMAERMFMRNFDTNLIFYLVLVAGTVAITRWSRRHDPAPSEAVEQALIVRERGAVRRVAFADIDWIGAAGDYAEVHGAAGAVLLPESLASLSRRLPSKDFARIHRSSLVRIDRIAEVQGVGRGDAEVRLTNGTRLRLSRRYRAGIATLLRTDPAHRA